MGCPAKSCLSSSASQYSELPYLRGNLGHTEDGKSIPEVLAHSVFRMLPETWRRRCGETLGVRRDSLLLGKAESMRVLAKLPLSSQPDLSKATGPQG